MGNKLTSHSFNIPANSLTQKLLEKMDEEDKKPLVPKGSPLFPPPALPVPVPPKSYLRSTKTLMSNEMVSVIIQQEPKNIEPTENFHQTSLMNDNYLILSIGLTIFSICFGCLPAIFCSIPAIVYSAKARRACALGELEVMRAQEKKAFALNIFVLLFWIVAFTLVATVTYRVKCGEAGIKCNTSPYLINQLIYNV